MINRILRRFGFEVVSLRYRQERRRLAEGREFQFIQVGANDGIRFDDLFDFVTSHVSRGLVVEPMKDYYDDLCVNYRHWPAIQPVRAAIHSTCRSMPLFRVRRGGGAGLACSATGMSSFSKEHLLAGGVPEEDVTVEEVPCLTLMELIESGGFEGLELLQIDVEGYDYEVLKQLDFGVLKPALIKYEHSSLSRTDWRESKRLLRRNGYRVFREKHDTIGVLRENRERFAE